MTAPRSKRPEWQPSPGRSKLERIALNSLSLAGWELDQAAASTDPESVFVYLKYGLKYMDEFLRFYERSKGVGGRKVGNCHRCKKENVPLATLGVEDRSNPTNPLYLVPLEVCFGCFNQLKIYYDELPFRLGRAAFCRDVMGVPPSAEDMWAAHIEKCSVCHKHHIGHRSSKGPCSNGRKLLSDMRLAQAAKEQGL